MAARVVAVAPVLFNIKSSVISRYHHHVVVNRRRRSVTAVSSHRSRLRLWCGDIGNLWGVRADPTAGMIL